MIRNFRNHTIQLRKDGRYTARVTDQGHTHCFYGKTKKEVQQKLEVFIDELNATAQLKYEMSHPTKYTTLKSWAYLCLNTYCIANIQGNTFEKYDIYCRMLGGKSVEDFEAEVKRKFIEEPYNMKLLIVVDKLLTGFDAPPCTYLYIDKSMHDHGMFQAICRVNRLDGESKDFGYIIDYKQLFGDLADAINTYTSGAFEDYDAEDVEGLLKGRTEEAKKFLKKLWILLTNSAKMFLCRKKNLIIFIISTL